MTDAIESNFIDAEVQGKRCLVAEITHCPIEHIGWLTVVGSERPDRNACVDRLMKLDPLILEIRVLNLQNDERSINCIFRLYDDGWCLRQPSKAPRRSSVRTAGISKSDLSTIFLASYPEML